MAIVLGGVSSHVQRATAPSALSKREAEDYIARVQTLKTKAPKGAQSLVNELAALALTALNNVVRRLASEAWLETEMREARRLQTGAATRMRLEEALYTLNRERNPDGRQPTEAFEADAVDLGEFGDFGLDLVALTDAEEEENDPNADRVTDATLQRDVALTGRSSRSRRVRPVLSAGAQELLQAAHYTRATQEV